MAFIELPPLRERREDLPALCAALLQRIGQEAGMPVPALSARALDALRRQPLHGNVRELENLLHRAVALSEGGELSMELDAGDDPPADDEASHEAGAAPAPFPPDGLLPEATAPTTRPATDAMPSDLQRYLDDKEREILLRALQETGFNRTAAAQRLGLSLRQIRYRIVRLGIPMPSGDDG